MVWLRGMWWRGGWVSWHNAVKDEKIEIGGMCLGVADPISHFNLWLRFSFMWPLSYLLFDKVQRMMNNPFKPPKDRKSTFSNNPKNISNWKYQKQKRGLDIALHRTQSNFRVWKSGALKRLTSSNEWANLAHLEQEKKKKKVIADRIREYFNWYEWYWSRNFLAT